MALYLILRLAHEVMKYQRRRKNKKPAEQRHRSAGTSTVVFSATRGSNGSWTNARIP